MEQTVRSITWRLRNCLNPVFDTSSPKPITPAFVCGDGCTLSVQASSGHYCAPREDFGFYTEVEVWHVTGVEPEDVVEWEYDTDEPAGYVPIEKVAEFILRHGGLGLSHLHPHCGLMTGEN